jgi:molybdopterin converting factor small subunit
MLSVRVRFMGDLRAVVGKRETIAEMPQGSTVKDLLASLCSRFGEVFSSRVLNPRGSVEHHVLVFLNGRNIKDLEGLGTSLGNGRDGGEVELMMLPMFEGG